MSTTFDHMTRDQRSIIRIRERTAFARLEEAYRNAAEAHKAIVPLPHTNEEGLPVLASCNSAMIGVRDSWRGIAFRCEVLCEGIDLERTRALREEYGGEAVCGGKLC